MADRIKGLKIVLSADSSELIKSIQTVNDAMRKTQANLRDINRALKFDPKNTELLKDKQNELTDAIAETKLKIAEEERAMQSLKDAGISESSQQFRDLKTQIDLDKSALKGFEDQLKNFGSVGVQVIKEVGREIKEVGDKMKGIGDKIADIGSNLTTKVTVPIVAAGGTMVAKYAEVDKTMTLANKTMNNTAEEAKMLNNAMEQAAANSTFGMNDAANASLNFARAGLDAAQAASALAPAMNLAAGEAGDLDTVSGGLVATINGFGDEFENAEHYADVFAAACNNSALDVNTLAESMSVAAPIFNTAGKDVEDAALMLGVMANAGIEANVAANSLKTGMARLAEPTKQAREAMDEYGITMDQIWNEDGSMKDMTVIQKNLNESFSQLSEQEQMAAAGAIFGKNQMAAWLAVINTAPEDVQELADSLSEVDGTTREMADAMMGGFGGSIEKLKSSIDVLMTSLGQLIAQYLTPVIEKIQGVVDKFMALDDETKNHIIQVAAIVAAVGPVLLIVGKVVVAIGTVISAIGTIVTAIGAVIGGIQAFGAAFVALTGPVGIVVAVIAGVVAAIVLLWNNCETFRTAVIEIWENVKNTFNTALDAIKLALSNAANNMKAVWTAIKTDTINTANNIKTELTNTWNNIKSFMQNTINNIKSNVSTAFTNIKNTITDNINGAKDAIVNGMQSACDFISSLPGKFYSWGSDMINSLIDGIKSKISAVGDAISGVASTISSYIHFSEPDKGPLSNASSFMPDFMKLLSQGIMQGIPEIESAMNALSSSMVPSTGGMTSENYGTTNNTSNNSFSFNIYGAAGQDVDELADAVQDRINQLVYQDKAAFQ